ncbi:hypothetical protein PMAYCL1PPCAC_31803 [Pristionchus mayeri]|uniref:Uncharacterized protein n=1 Tax=Pristionchus mayeri TaxID=1317129 RepID=A0AAN5DDL7_9BILA|nr:hypothetical protein PMAYCL1PPCAC_31803 [Pristionchus mayeri]
MITTYLLLSLLGVTAVQGWSIHIQPSGERLLNRVAGENFLVVCSVKEYEGPASNVQVNWIHNNEIIRAGGRIMTIEKPLSSQLMIVRARKEDSGDYMCQVKLDGGIKVEPAKITFIKAPKFIDPETEQHPEDGTTAEIECKVDAEPGVEIFWQFNGDTLGESTSRPYEFKDNKQILVIPRFDSKKDDGLYLCNAAQFSSFETLHINVTAYSRPSITIFESPKEDLGYEGKSAQFKCAATGKPAPSYKWFKVAEDEEIVASDLYTVEDGLLVVNSLTASNSGQYKCVATNEIGEDDQTATLKVFLKPAVEKIPSAVKEDGEEVTFTCEFTGEGKVNARFVFGEEEYKVISTTEASNEIEDKEDKDENEVEKADEDGDDDEDETTTGDAKDEEEDDEEEEKKWKRFVRDITSERVSVKEEDGVLKLTIRRLTSSDAGDYQCIVENEAGKTVRSANLAITHAPEITGFEREPVRASDGEEFKLHCEASAVPEPTWTWKRDGNEVEADGTRVTIESDTDSSTLTIKDAVKADFGSIECIAFNGVGEPAKATMTVVRVVAPATPSAPNCREHLFPNYGVCTLNAEDFESEEGDATPEEIVFYVATQDEAKEEGFDFVTQARNFTVNFNGAKMRLHGLDVNKGYFVRAIARNEAGESELSPQGTMETTDPWTPEAPIDVLVKCDTSCEVSWTEPNDHGAEITSYKIEVIEMETNEHNEVVPSGEKDEYDVDADEESFVIPSMKPNTRYEIAVIAANSIGQSSATPVTFDTPDTVTSSMSLESLSSPKMIVVIIVVILLVFLVIDVLCCFFFRCGIIACFLGCCRSDHKKSAAADLESGKAAESGRLLDGPAR